MNVRPPAAAMSRSICSACSSPFWSIASTAEWSWSARPATTRRALVVTELSDDDLLRAIRDLGGHDLGDLREAFARADAVTDRPSVIFAYTIKAWRLATQGHPANHSALLSAAQMERLANETGGGPGGSMGALSRRFGRGQAMPRGGGETGAR